MRTHLLSLSLATIGLFLPRDFVMAQDSNSGSTVVNMTVEMGLGQAINDFTEVKKNPMFQAHIDLTFTPKKDNHAVELGLQFGLMPFGNRVDDISGLEITSQAILYDFGPMIRIRPQVDWKIQPWIDGSLSMGISNTKSTYEIVDEPTFLEAFLLNKETEIETKKLKSFNDYGLFKIVGVGFDFNMFYLHFKYVNSAPLNFVSPEGVLVEDGVIQYKAVSSNVRFFTIGFGFNLNKVLAAQEN